MHQEGQRPRMLMCSRRRAALSSSRSSPQRLAWKYRPRWACMRGLAAATTIDEACLQRSVGRPPVAVRTCLCSVSHQQATSNQGLDLHS